MEADAYNCELDIRRRIMSIVNCSDGPLTVQEVNHLFYKAFGRGIPYRQANHVSMESCIASLHTEGLRIHIDPEHGGMLVQRQLLPGSDGRSRDEDHEAVHEHQPDATSKFSLGPQGRCLPASTLCNIKKLIRRYPEGIEVAHLQQLYRQTFGQDLHQPQSGNADLVELLEDLFQVLEVKVGPDRVMVHAKTAAHSEQMLPLEDEVLARLQGLMAAHPQGLRLESLPSTYKEMYGFQLNVQSYCCVSTLEFCSFLPSLFRLEATADQGWMIFQGDKSAPNCESGRPGHYESYTDTTFDMNKVVQEIRRIVDQGSGGVSAKQLDAKFTEATGLTWASLALGRLLPFIQGHVDGVGVWMCFDGHPRIFSHNWLKSGLPAMVASLQAEANAFSGRPGSSDKNKALLKSVARLPAGSCGTTLFMNCLLT